MQDAAIDLQMINRLLDMIGGDLEDLRELIDEFEQTTPALVDTMRISVSQGDLAGLRIAAHTLKSNARDMGAMALTDLCATLEHAARDGSVDDPDRQVAAIDAELTKARSALAQMTLGDG